MAVLRPFKSLRPRKDLVHKVAALPYDVMSSEEARSMVKDNPYSFLHVDKAEIDLDRSIDLYDQRVYEKARENLTRMIHDGIYIKDKSSCFYIYKLVMDGREQTGIVGCTSIDDYQNNIIKKHELTREDKELDRIKHVDYCNAHTGPIFLTYRSKKEINDMIEFWMKNNDPIYDFTAEDNIRHIVWMIDDQSVIDQIKDVFNKIDYLYIADGHHRAASAVKVGLKRREEGSYTGEEEFNFFLSVLFPDDQLHIMDYNRVVKDLNGLSEEEFLKALNDKFIVEKFEESSPYKPRKKHEFGMYIDHTWYRLTAREGSFNDKDPVERLDVSILQNNLLHPILGIADPRTDQNIDFVGGIRGLKELEIRVQNGMKVAFSLYPPSIKDLMDIADANKIMPPKSTWFEPKLRSGIFIHSLEE
ncbi:MAG: hypothetical protein PWP07_1403 [Epulopiscium sp.]|jgi:uncharacterized protein (DUF1015 family)|uniref:DUF1015 family protein n=1 Tax=Defluviitalea raffinosedens TaxID=1450156 RepID=A0A7C8HG37_9FIRM|nr:DUF1015 family protein [Defluviitalea raffinosedens]MBZ4668163.1 hypothetical protein [Defluviitaleaceae bacterium]MDK2788178.1 hypothetical protein [Candidatus Epulonipiscium sp.]KAE9636955.1 DUF1015 family protein [Defluviitalea raffinosedens]MBM7685294.1 uncharacterized protein (DUF1015 family) [Defluviitalea raffinosedens]HHW67267.1 DUF1015 family protein [Candidatus Epulonipiscium sp.]